jgi:hypothetical protein
MGQINVKGLGVVNIAGDTPTDEEAKAIKTQVEQKQKDMLTQGPAEKATDDFLNDFSWGRLVTEAGLAIGGSILTGGLALPGLAIRSGMLARPFLAQLAKSSIGSGVGAGTGAAVSQTFDPKDDVVKEVVRAATEGALAEAIGGPALIKGGQVVAKYLNKPKNYTNLLEGADNAEKALMETAEKIIANPAEYAQREGLSELATKNLVQSAETFKKYGLTPGVKSNNRAVEIIENITSKSLFGGAEIASVKQSAKEIGEFAAKDILEDFNKVADKEEFGLLFFNTFQKGNTAFRAQSDKFYATVDSLLGNSKFKPIIPVKKIDASLKEVMDNIEIPGDSPIFATFGAIKKTIRDREGLYTFKQLNGLRGELLQKMRDVGYDNNKAVKQIDQIIKSIDDVLSPESVSKIPGIDPKAMVALKNANEFYKAGADVFDRGILKGILSSKQAGVVDNVFQNIVKTGDKSNTVGKVLTEIDTMSKLGKNEFGAISVAEANQLRGSLKGQFLSDLFAKSRVGNPQFGAYYDASKFAEKLRGKSSTIKKLFTPDELARVKSLENTLAFAQGELTQSGGLPGGILIQMKQAGAAGQIISLGTLAPLGAAGAFALGGAIPAVAILATPFALNKMLLSKWFQNKLFAEPTKLAAKGELTPSKASVIYRQIVGRMFTEGYIPEDEKDRVNAELDLLNQPQQQAQPQQAQPQQQRSSLQLPSFTPSNVGASQISPQARVALAGGNLDQAIAAQGMQQMPQLKRGGIVSAKK